MLVVKPAHIDFINVLVSIFLLDLWILNVNNIHKKLNFYLEVYMTHIRINHPNLDLPLTVYQQIERALTQALDCFAGIIREADVTLRDTNGPKGGIDKQCTVQIRFYPRGLAIVKSKGSSFAGSVNGVCDKIHQVVSKRHSKRKSAKGRAMQAELVWREEDGN